MKRFLLAGILALIGGGSLSASQVIACSGDPAAINNCISSNLANFTSRLDWAAFETLVEPGGRWTGTGYSGNWTAVNVLPGMNLTISSQGLGSNPNLGLAGARNLGMVMYTPLPGVVPPDWYLQPGELGYSYAGRFPNIPDPFGSTSAILSNEAIHLMGLVRDGASPDPMMVLDFSRGFTNLGFYASGNAANPFNLLVKVYDENGNLLREGNFLNLLGGGECASLKQMNPTACGNAPFIYASGFGGAAKRVVISSSNDVTGFQISGLDLLYSTHSPEPGAMILSGCGIALLALGRKRWRKKA